MVYVLVCVAHFAHVSSVSRTFATLRFLAELAYVRGHYGCLLWSFCARGSPFWHRVTIVQEDRQLLQADVDVCRLPAAPVIIVRWVIRDPLCPEKDDA